MSNFTISTQKTFMSEYTILTNDIYRILIFKDGQANAYSIDNNYEFVDYGNSLFELIEKLKKIKQTK